MFEPSFSRSGMRRARLRTLASAGFALSAIAMGAIAACSKDSTGPGGARLVYGPAQALGQGTARVYVGLDASGKPASLGVALSEAALTNLPQTPLPGGGMAAATLSLALPQEAKSTGFDHVMLDWNPMGHEPDMVYTLPHFDFHFYTIPEATQMAMTPADPQFAAKLEKMPPEAYRPVGTIKFPGGVPMMGAHWADPTSPELLPPPNNKTFTRTFLFGSYDGHFIFYEPMITRAHIESVKTVQGNLITTPIAIAPSVEHPGSIPTRYTIAWDAAAKEYRIALDNLVPRS
jgi:hypothetical protein